MFHQIDLEEAKGQEISKLQKALQEMQTQLDEAHDAIIHEKEAAKIAIEQAPPVIKEVPVIDNTKVEKLTEENNKLEVKSGNKILCLYNNWYGIWPSVFQNLWSLFQEKECKYDKKKCQNLVNNHLPKERGFDTKKSFTMIFQVIEHKRKILKSM